MSSIVILVSGSAQLGGGIGCRILVRRVGSQMLAVQVFLYLQLLDFFTTLVGFRVGASEASPFIAKLIHASSPAVGVAASKFLALMLGGLCVASNRARLILWINYWYAALVIWNLCIILSASNRLAV